MSGEPRDELVETRVVDGHVVEIYGLYTVGEGTEQPGDDGYDVWLSPPGAEADGSDALHINEGDILYEIPTDEQVRELIDEADL